MNLVQDEAQNTTIALGGLRPALVDYLDRVDEATFPGRTKMARAGGLTATRGHDMTGAPACPSPIPTHDQA